MRPRHLAFCVLLACLIAWTLWNIASEPQVVDGTTIGPPDARSRLAAIPADLGAEVTRAGKRLLAKKNVQVDTDIRFRERSTHTRVEYTWPDRYHSVHERQETISIADDTYSKLDDFWIRLPVGTYNNHDLYRSLFSPEKWTKAKDVRSLGTEILEGHAAVVYTYQTPQGKAYCSEKLWVGKETGLPARVESTCSEPFSIDITQVFTYDSTITVDAPATSS